MSDARATTSRFGFPRGRIGHGLLVAAAMLLCGLPARAEVCRPVLNVKQSRFSDVRDMQRIWRAVVAVDASRCASESGSFEIRFVRAKENALDLPFTQTFGWRPGTVEVALAFWADEAVQHAGIGRVGACPCRE
jgi:hypothetical protein